MEDENEYSEEHEHVSPMGNFTWLDNENPSPLRHQLLLLTFESGRMAFSVASNVCDALGDLMIHRGLVARRKAAAEKLESDYRREFAGVGNE